MLRPHDRFFIKQAADRVVQNKLDARNKLATQPSRAAIQPRSAAASSAPPQAGAVNARQPTTSPSSRPSRTPPSVMQQHSRPDFRAPTVKPPPRLQPNQYRNPSDARIYPEAIQQSLRVSQSNRPWYSLDFRGRRLDSRLEQSRRQQGYGATPTFRQHVSRWYDNTPGGFDKAVSDAQQAQKVHDQQRLLNRRKYPRWQASGVDVPVPTWVGTGGTPGRQHVMGFSQLKRPNETNLPSNSEVWINHPSGEPFPQNALEHELSHSLYTPRQTRLGRAREGAFGPLQEPASVRGEELSSYMADPAEVDVRLAEMKRRYTAATGKPVNTLQSAQAAWRYFHDELSPRLGRYERGSPDSPQQAANKKLLRHTKYRDSVNHPSDAVDDLPTYRPIDSYYESPFYYYPTTDYDKAYDGKTKVRLYRRMLELVNAGGRSNPAAAIG